MALTIVATAANTKKQSAAAENAQALQNIRKCKYCKYQHWDEFALKFHEEMHKEYCEEKRLNYKSTSNTK
jgi:hypothetical protein